MANTALTLPQYINNEGITLKLYDVLGKKTPAFKTALLNIYHGNVYLQKCDPRSILGAAVLSATLDLSISPTLGYAYIVPYGRQAQFQIGVRGLIQLAHRTGKYVAMHAGKVYEGEIRRFNPITGEPELGEKISDEVVGYVAYMRLDNGFEKTLYMSKAEIEAHAEKYSQSYGYDKRSGKSSSPWTTNFDAMASKTLLKKLLRTWGILSAEMATAIQADQSVVDKNTFTYTDNSGNVQNRGELYIPEPEVESDMETGEIVEVEEAEPDD